MGGRYRGVESALGTFKIIQIGQKHLIVNAVFLNQPTLSGITLEDFGRKLLAVKGVALQKVVHEKYFHEDEQARYLASVDEDIKKTASKTSQVRELASGNDVIDGNEKQVNTQNIFWLLMVLAILGMLAARLAYHSKS